jgi:hypothetical protein
MHPLFFFTAAATKLTTAAPKVQVVKFGFPY